MVQKVDSMDFEIMLALLRGGSHLRGVAKQLDASHSTVSRVLGKLYKENIIDFKQEGKNKVFFIRKNIQARNYVLIAERYKLIKLLKQYPEFSIIMDNILRACGEKLIVLFGSYSKGLAKKDSDIDIYVETENRKIKDKIESLHSKIKVKLGRFNTDSQLIKEIIKNHVILKGEEEFYEKTRFFDQA
jgi:predicted nucleotidyltransferase